jgi:hypothetical protein
MVIRQSTPKISVTSKLDGIRSWSLQALDTCPGSKNKDGSLVDACAGCYATTGNYRYPNVIAPRAHNREDWQSDDWVMAMVQSLANDRYFRWFDSGDMYSIDLARKIYMVMQATPHVKHWLPTRMHKFAKFQPIIELMRQLPNVVVRASSDSIEGEILTNQSHSSTISSFYDDDDAITVCKAYEHGGKCSGCRACWDQSVPVIGYVAHGVKMAKVIRLKVSA